MPSSMQDLITYGEYGDYKRATHIPHVLLSIVPAPPPRASKHCPWL